jgi:PAS domain S-box-containing protein
MEVRNMEPRGESGRRRPGRPLQVYFVALALVFVLVGAAAGAYVYVQSNANDRQSATADASFAARKAADEFTFTLDIIQKTKTSGLGAVFANPTGCHLTYASIGAFEKGRIELVRADGTVICTSQGSLPAGKPYAGQAWVQVPTAGVIAPLNDPETGHQAAVISLPVETLGVLIWVIELAPVGPKLNSEYGSGVNQLEFVVTTADGKTIIARSIDSDKWTGASLAGTPFATSADPVDKADVTGTRRWYGESTVPSVGWKVYVGADQAKALTASSRLQQQEFAIIAFGVLLTLLALAFVYRQVARPVAALSSAVRSSRGLESPANVPIAGPAEVAGLGEDINDLIASLKREWSERESAQRRYARLFEGSPLPMTVTDPKTLQLIDANDAAAEFFGYTREELKSLRGTDLYVPSDDEERQEVNGIGISERLGTNYIKAGPLSFRKKDGSMVRAIVTSYEVDFGGSLAYVATIEDVTEKEKLEVRFRQAERLESLGQLAGGVAHDFNNLLAVILNVTASLKSQAQEAIDKGDARSGEELRDIERIEKAGQSAARLTRQLLSFARREVAQKSVLDVSEQVEGLTELLRRTLGSHVVLQTALEPHLWPVLMDRGQLEQVLINLSVNARDAMRKGGTLLISTKNVTIDEFYAEIHPGIKPGRHVELQVADTGTGMDKATQEHLFEPFFTTKPAGQGTGLGLATVYGVVKQAEGQVTVYSEVGRGTTITVLLPATDAERPADAAPIPVKREAATGTVLVVEDYPELRQLIEEILKGNGYRVLSAPDGAEALTMAREHAGEIDILLTDVVMPNMLGPDLAAQLKTENPNLRALFMSGHAQPALGGAAALPADVPLLQKPFMARELLDKLSEVLAAAPYGGGPA